MVRVPEDRELFLCYSRRDSSELCVQLYHWLRREGVQAFCDLVDDPDGNLGDRIYDVIRRSSAVLLVGSPASIADLRNPASWVSRELACAADAHRRVILLRLPGVDSASCARLQPSNTVVAGATPLSTSTLRSLMSAAAVRALPMDDTRVDHPGDHARRRAEFVGLIRKTCQAERLATDVRSLWPLLRSTFTADETVTLSSQGFFVLPVYSRIERGQIHELIRLHFWSRRAAVNPFAVHSHQPHTTSWVLSGVFLNTIYQVVPSLPDYGTSLFEVRWDSSEHYRVQHKVSTVINTGEAVSTEFECSATFNGGQSYTVPAGEFHSTVTTATDLEFAASLFFFDSGKGWVAKAPVVGPAKLTRSTQRRETKIAARYFLDRLDSLLS
jgi:TIR domain